MYQLNWYRTLTNITVAPLGCQKDVHLIWIEAFRQGSPYLSLFFAFKDYGVFKADFVLESGR